MRRRVLTDGVNESYSVPYAEGEFTGQLGLETQFYSILFFLW